ncbi:MAG: hypothetical protein K2P99_03245, partial [Burkholderiales bacterium]|nr:hypothetical protein [Burkholderiales bacterium]
MDDLYNKVQQILKDSRIFIPYNIEEDLIHECISCALENQDEIQAVQTKLILSCANHFLYEHRKYKKIARFDDAIQNDCEGLVISNNEVIQYSHNSSDLDEDAICRDHLLSVKDLIISKGDYTLVEIAQLLQITRFHLHKSIKHNKLGLKSRLKLKKLVKYDKKSTMHKLINTMIKEKIVYHELNISRSSWYYGIHNGFSYSQARKIAIILKQQFNIQGIV